MSEIKELQAEEKEALISIYEGDSCFHVIEDTKYQYKVSEMVFLWLERIFSGVQNFPNFFSTAKMMTQNHF